MSTADRINWATLKTIIESDIRTWIALQAKAEAGLGGLGPHSATRAAAKLEALADVQASMATLEGLSAEPTAAELARTPYALAEDAAPEPSYRMGGPA